MSEFANFSEQDPRVVAQRVEDGLLVTHFLTRTGEVAAVYSAANEADLKASSPLSLMDLIREHDDDEQELSDVNEQGISETSNNEATATVLSEDPETGAIEQLEVGGKVVDKIDKEVNTEGSSY